MATKEVSTGSTGRPTLLTDEMIDRAEMYIYSYHEQGDVIPSTAGLACWLGVAKSSVHLWRSKSQRFSDTLDAIQAKQETIALNKGLSGDFNSTITKLVLNNHGYSDKQEVAHTSPDGSMSPAPAIDASKLSTDAIKELIAAAKDNVS